MKKGKNVEIKAHFPAEGIKLWSYFVREIRSENRFFLKEKTEKFISHVIEYGKKYKMACSTKNNLYYRARRYNLNQMKNYTLDELKAPPPKDAKHGRVNPIGIPYLYLATDIETAIAEVRPWIDGKLNVAEFKLKRNLELLNCSIRGHHKELKEGQNEGIELIWKQIIAWMFSAPFDPRDTTAYYPTQYIAERAKKSEIDGIIYDSALNKNGYNICLFDVSSAAPTKKMFKAVVKEMNYKTDIQEINSDKS